MLNTLSNSSLETFIHYLNAYLVLEQCEDKSPCNSKVNEALSQLVTSICQEYKNNEATNQWVIENPLTQTIYSKMLRHLAQAEYEMELYYSKRYNEQTNLSREDISNFLYFNQYKQLLMKEIEMIKQLIKLDHYEKVAFIGSGPLPISVFLLKEYLQKPVFCIDYSHQANQLAMKLTEKLSINTISYYTTFAHNIHYDDSTIIFIASLTMDKEKLLKHLSKVAPKALIIVRSADSVHRLLYHPVDEKMFRPYGYEQIAKTYGDALSINSSLFLKQK